MNYEVITGRWPCPVCGGPLRLVFTPSGFDEHGHAHGTECGDVFCRMGHGLPKGLLDEVGRHAEEELGRALEGGLHVGEVWRAPDDEGTLAPLGPS